MSTYLTENNLILTPTAAGLPFDIPANTVTQACVSANQAVTSAMYSWN